MEPGASAGEEEVAASGEASSRLSTSWLSAVELEDAGWLQPRLSLARMDTAGSLASESAPPTTPSSPSREQQASSGSDESFDALCDHMHSLAQSPLLSSFAPADDNAPAAVASTTPSGARKGSTFTVSSKRGPMRIATATPASLKLSNKPQRVPAKTPRTPKTPAAAGGSGAAEKIAPRSCPSRVDVMKDTNGRPRSARADLKSVVGASLASAATPRAIASARGAQKAEKKGSVLVQPRWM